MMDTQTFWGWTRRHFGTDTQTIRGKNGHVDGQANKPNNNGLQRQKWTHRHTDKPKRGKGILCKHSSAGF